MAADATAVASGQTLAETNAARRSRRPSMWRAIRRQRLAMTGAILIAFFAVIAVIGPSVAPYGPTEQHIKDRMQAPTGTYWLGTDQFGRDVLSRLLHGARI